jgi:hypothetical protein
MSIPKQTATMLPLVQLVPHPNNVRKSVGDVSELAASIRQNGIVQPIVVTQHPKKTGVWLVPATCGWLELNNGFMFFTDRTMWEQTSNLFGIEAVVTS